MKKKILETRCAEVWLEEDNIIYVSIKHGAEIKLDDVMEVKKTNAKLVGDRKHLLCINISNIKSITKEARDFTGDMETKNERMLAMALIMGSPISRVVGNFYIGLNKPLYPTKLFNDKEKAFKWLKGFLNKPIIEIDHTTGRSS